MTNITIYWMLARLVSDNNCCHFLLQNSRIVFTLCPIFQYFYRN